jgi:ABC-type multidrug transport system fused ATPase/permease subunit
VLRDVQQKMADVATVAEENIVGVHVVKSFAQEQNELDKFADRSERVFQRSVDANKQRALYVPLLSFLPLIMQAGVLLAGGRMVAHGTLDIQTFFFFNVLVVMLVMPLRMLGMWVGQSQRATAVRRADLRGHGRARGDRGQPACDEMPPGEGRVATRA